MKTVIIFLVLISGILSGCEPKIQYDCQVWVNEEAEVCGVKNPIENIDWLKKINQLYVDDFNYYVKSNKYYEYVLSIYENNISAERYFVIQWFSEYYEAYDCSQNEPFKAGKWKKENQSSTQQQNVQPSPLHEPICEGCDEFFENSTFLYDLVIYRNIQIQ